MEEIKLCQECLRECERPRPNGCTHECSIGYCHPDKCKDCNVLIKLKCHCNSNFVYAECFKWNSSNQNEQELIKSCKVPCSKTVKKLI